MQHGSFVDEFGVEVATYSWPIDRPDGLVLISHGASEHAGRYDRFAQALNAAGFAAAALDHRGHGRTAATGQGVMGPGGGDAVVADLHELRRRATSTTGELPTFLFAHSMGSLIGAAYLTRHADGLAGAVLCGFPADPNGMASFGEVLRGIADAGMRDQVINALGEMNAPFEPARTPADWLSRDPDEVDRYLADPMCGDDNPLTYGYVIDVFEVVETARDRLTAISCPVFVIAGDQDPAAGMGAYATAIAAALRDAGVDVDVTLYGGARHELLNETNRDAITDDIIGWLRSHA